VAGGAAHRALLGDGDEDGEEPHEADGVHLAGELFLPAAAHLRTVLEEP